MHETLPRVLCIPGTIFGKLSNVQSKGIAICPIFNANVVLWCSLEWGVTEDPIVHTHLVLAALLKSSLDVLTNIHVPYMYKSSLTRPVAQHLGLVSNIQQGKWHCNVTTHRCLANLTKHAVLELVYGYVPTEPHQYSIHMYTICEVNLQTLLVNSLVRLIVHCC